MISVIICSINELYLSNIKRNIAETIGVEHEIIAFDNRETNFGISKVYNDCAKKSKFQYLCFVHEDVIFKTNNWGIILIRQSINDTGIIGSAGGTIATNEALSWGSLGDKYARYNFIQHHSKKGLRVYKNNPNNEEFSQVLLLDGVFLFTRKCVWEQVRFDEKTFIGFNLYDLDFSFAVTRMSYKNYVCHTIDIIHFSYGNFNLSYLKSAYLFQKKWNYKLPVSIEDLSTEQWRKVEAKALYMHIRGFLIKTKTNKQHIRKKIREFQKRYPFDSRIFTLYFKLFFRFLRSFD